MANVLQETLGETSAFVQRLRPLYVQRLHPLAGGADEDVHVGFAVHYQVPITVACELR